MKKKIIFLFLLLSSFLFAGADILQYVTTPVAVGQGNISTILNKDTILTVNQSPANLGFVYSPGISLSYNRVANAFNFLNVAAVYPVDGSLGLSFSYLNYGEDLMSTGIDSYGSVSYGSEKVGSYDAVIGLGYGIQFNKFLVGADGKYILNALADDKKSYFCGDINILYLLGNNKNIGVSLKNMGSDNIIVLPSYGALGILYPVFEMKGKEVILALFGEGRYYLSDYQMNKVEGTLGVQYSISGFIFNLSGILNNNAQFISLAGLGVSYTLTGPVKLKIDYAMDMTSEVIGANHSIAMSYFFATSQKENKGYKRQQDKIENNTKSTNDESSQIMEQKQEEMKNDTKQKTIKKEEKQSTDEWEDE